MAIDNRYSAVYQGDTTEIAPESPAKFPAPRANLKT